MNIQKKLSLNKHPGDCMPYSLVAAKNVKVSNDDRMIVNEEGLENRYKRHEEMSQYFKK